MHLTGVRDDQVKDIYGGDCTSLGLPGDLIASSFGKAAQASPDAISGKRGALPLESNSPSLANWTARFYWPSASFLARFLVLLARGVFAGFLLEWAAPLSAARGESPSPHSHTVSLFVSSFARYLYRLAGRRTVKLACAV